MHSETMTYDASPFEVTDIARAQAIILTPSPEGRTTHERWQVETYYLADLIIDCCRLTPGMSVLDYGCGIGRLAKPLIEQAGVRVTGVDTSGHMRALAEDYVGSDQFITLPPEGLDHLLREDDAQFDAAISVWTLQHAKYPMQDIDRIDAALHRDGRLFVVNEKRRCVPTRELGWIDDGFDLRKHLASTFTCIVEGTLMPSRVGKATSRSAFWAIYESNK